MWSDFVAAAPDLANGIAWTLLFTLVGAVGAVIVSFILGLMALSRRVAVRGVSRVIVEFFRGTSLVIQLLWFAFVLPQLKLGLALTPEGAAVVALALNYGAYGSEIVRGAINAVPKAQWEATTALSLTPLRRMRRVIFPQAFPEMLPPFANLLVQLLKGSSLLFIIGIIDFSRQLQNLRGDIPSLWVFGVGLVIYFILAQILMALMRLAESRAAARVGRGKAFNRRAARAAAERGAAEAPVFSRSGNGGAA